MGPPPPAPAARVRPDDPRTWPPVLLDARDRWLRAVLFGTWAEVEDAGSGYDEERRRWGF